jgi:hypothetical protein
MCIKSGRTLLAAELGGVHSLAQHLDRKPTGLLEVTLLFVVLFQQALRRGIVCTDTRSLPATVVATGIALVQLKLSLWVPTGVDEGHAKRPEPTMLRVALFEIAKTAHELLAGDVFVVGEQVALGGLAGVIDEDVGVGCHACYGADHVAITISAAIQACIYTLTHSFKMYSFSAEVSCSNSLLVTFLSAASTMPS